MKIIISSSDLSIEEKAEILYKHILHSNIILSKFKNFILRKEYFQIINHQNFNPRIIEQVILLINLENNIGSQFVKLLDNPIIIWENSFRNLPNPSKWLLLILGTLPHNIKSEELEKAFYFYAKYQKKTYLHSYSSDDYYIQLRELENSFIKISKIWDDNNISFINPSVKDYVIIYITSQKNIINDLINSLCYFEQLTYIWQYLLKIFESSNKIEQKIIENFTKAVDQTINQFDLITPLYFTPFISSKTMEDRLLFLIEISKEINSKKLNNIIQREIYTICNKLDKIKLNKKILIQISRELIENQIPNIDILNFQKQIITYLFDSIYNLDDYLLFFSMRTVFPNLIMGEYYQELEEKFIGTYKGILIRKSDYLKEYTPPSSLAYLYESSSVK